MSSDEIPRCAHGYPITAWCVYCDDGGYEDLHYDALGETHE